jgi:hypothetical protein
MQEISNEIVIIETRFEVANDLNTLVIVYSA